MEEMPFEPLERGLLRLMQIHGAAIGGLLVAAAAAGEAVLHASLALPWGLQIGPALLVLVYLALWSPPRRYRAWAYRMDGEELQLRHGIWTKVETLVPLDRVQHIDISQGPLERALGICSLVLHTAGTLHSQIVLPGLARETAERMRDEIRARIREEPA
ncbi:MAG TPA: PH domain-containing protein [Allosphingosinicella sp.]